MPRRIPNPPNPVQQAMDAEDKAHAHLVGDKPPKDPKPKAKGRKAPPPGRRVNLLEHAAETADVFAPGIKGIDKGAFMLYIIEILTMAGRKWEQIMEFARSEDSQQVAVSMGAKIDISAEKTVEGRLAFHKPVKDKMKGFIPDPDQPDLFGEIKLIEGEEF